MFFIAPAENAKGTVLITEQSLSIFLVEANLPILVTVRSQAKTKGYAD